MTNSITSGKCPSTLTSGKYGMSQRRSIIDDSKEYIFVKLTDSAFRAIEEYQRNAQSKRLQKGQSAKIQFIGNAGVIQFPPTVDNSATNGGGSSDGRKFGFAIDDVEGSLECIQQSGPDLDVLGSLSYRMRIHANDDVYDTTRTKMAIAEETEKSKCIREIKPNQTDIGRKVKRPVSAASIQAYNNGITTSSLLNGLTNGNGISSGSSNSISINGSSSYLSNSNNNNSISNSNSRSKLSTSLNQHSPPSSGGGGVGGGGNGSVNGSRLLSNASSLRSSPNPSLIGGSGTVGSGNNRYGSPSNLLSSISSSAGGYSPPGSGNNLMSGSINSQQKKANLSNGASSSSRGNGAGVTKSASGSNGRMNGKTNDVSRRKIRERLIHLLALKPFKKPELYSRLQNEGLAQRERQLISTILKDISTLSRDNTYNLRRSMWNDVDENWPFFTEQEIQQLKRRKPQNLTPPTSSDAGSSMSGQSPTSSIHTGSPPPLLASSIMNGGGIKRTSLEPDLYDGTLTLGTQSKKQRISHYKKDGSCLMNNSNLVPGSKITSNCGSSSYNQNHRPSSASYSPHNYNSNNGNDEISVNTDLSFNVLNNMDDFIQHTAVIGGDSSYAGVSKTTTGSSKISPSFGSANSSCNSTTSQAVSKEKRNSDGSSNSSGYGSNRENLSSSAASAIRRKKSPAPYANNFVPETKITTNSNNSNSSSRLSKQQQTQNNSNNQLAQKLASSSSCSNNSVISNINDDYSPSLPPPISQSTITNHITNSSSSRSRYHSNISETIKGRTGGESSSSSKNSRSSMPTQKNFSKLNSNINSKSNPTTSNIPQQQQLQNSSMNHQQQQEDQNTFTDSRTPPQNASHSSKQTQQQQEHSSPTQQIAAAASTFSLTNHSTSSGDAPRYDFSSYTPITSIEQRRKYKTEFESDYDEYRKLLAQIESVGHRFRELADRLNRVQQGCIDYYNIKDQIVSEYNRIRKEEAINRDKQRFDYLHEKLAHIKQLVMDYDKKLTSGLAVPATATANQQHQKQESSNQQQSTVSNNSAHLSPMLQSSSGESNHSPPLMIMNPNTVNAITTKNSLMTSSSPYTKKSSKHHHKNLQQKNEHKEDYKQHHEPETIQMVDEENDEGGDEEETSLIQYHQFPYNRYDVAGNRINRQQHIPSPENSALCDKRNQQQLKLQQHNQSPLQQLQNHNHNDSDSESDSTSSSSSNDDNSDDDNSDASDDENSDDDSNDDDNDDQ